jgi:hypothetical protein
MSIALAWWGSSGSACSPTVLSTSQQPTRQSAVKAVAWSSSRAHGDLLLLCAARRRIVPPALVRLLMRGHARGVSSAELPSQPRWCCSYFCREKAQASTVPRRFLLGNPAAVERERTASRSAAAALLPKAIDKQQRPTRQISRARYKAYPPTHRQRG